MNTVKSRDGTTIAFDRTGQGPALIVVGGAMSDRAAVAPLATVLAKHFTVFAYDRRGRGDSEDTAPYAVEREIEDLDALITEAGGSPFVLGHSSGAALSLRAAASGLAISKLAVYEPPFIVDDSRPPVPSDFVARLNEFVAAGDRDGAVVYFMTDVVGVPAEFVAQMREDPTWESSTKVAHTLAYDGAIMGDTMSGKPLSDEPWHSVTVPTLAMDGGASPEWQRNGARSLVEVLPDARHRTLEGQDHGPAGEVLAPVLVEFFLG